MTATPDPSRGAEPRTLNHFAVLRLTAAWWRLERADRCRRLRALQEALAGVADVLHMYQVFPLHDTGDLLAWTALRSAEPERVHAYFGGYARALAPLRPLLDPAAWRRSGRRSMLNAHRARSDAAVAPLCRSAAAAGGTWYPRFGAGRGRGVETIRGRVEANQAPFVLDAHRAGAV